MLMTRASRIVIEALVELSRCGSGVWMTAEEISKQTTGSLPSVKQLLHRLSQQGVLLSRQGRGGGYRLASDPEELTLRAVVATVEGRSADRCLLDSTSCDGNRGCQLAATWHPVREYLASFLERETIASIAGRNQTGTEELRPIEADG